MRKLFLFQFLFLGIVFFTFSAFDVFAASGCPTDFEMKSGVCFPQASTLGLSDVSVYDFLVKLMNWLLGILGIIGVIAFVISGTQYLVSAGDEEMAKTAKRNMTYAVIGLVVALAGLIVVNAIAGLTGAGGVTDY